MFACIRRAVDVSDEDYLENLAPTHLPYLEFISNSRSGQDFYFRYYHTSLQISKNLGRKIVNIFLPISLNICLGDQKNRLAEMGLLSTHNICFG